MRPLIRTILFSFLLLTFSTQLQAQKLSKSEIAKRDSIWKKIKPFFTPPAAFKGDFGKYRSPLKFEDGTLVKTPADWKKRRAEILNRWTNLMGEWPALLKNQKMEILETTQKDGYKEMRVRFNWTPNEKTVGYLLVPDSKGKKPAVVTVFYDPETAIGRGRSLTTPNFDFALQLTKRGFITLSIGTTDATKAKRYSLFYPSFENATVQPLSMLGYAAANAWYVLANYPQVDEKRIGITGLSFGGKWAMFGSTLFENYAAAAWSDPGIVFDESRSAVNYWESYYLGYQPNSWRKRGDITKDNPTIGLYPKLVAGGYDLHELHALMAPRPFLVSGGSEDPVERWIPLNHSIAVNNILGYHNRVAMTNRPTHRPDAKANVQMYEFFEYFLKYGGLNVKR